MSQRGNVFERLFYHIEDAYDVFQDKPLTGNTIIRDYFLTPFEASRVFVIDTVLIDGTTERSFFRSVVTDEHEHPILVEFIP